MSWKSEWKSMAAISAVFLAFFFIPVDNARFAGSLNEGLLLLKWYAREHVILCLVPAFFIAGAMAVFIGKESVLRYLGASANKVLSYGVASVSGSILAVCSCTVLPLFAGIYRMGAGIGPATAFLYAGPAINVLAVILTVRVLGLEIGIARMIGAVFFSVVIGLIMQSVFRGRDSQAGRNMPVPPKEENSRNLGQNAAYFASMVGILVFANWGGGDGGSGFWDLILRYKWQITAAFSVALAVILVVWLGISGRRVLSIGAITVLAAFAFPGKPVIPFATGAIGLSIITSTGRGEASDWFDQTWIFARQILPLLFVGVLVSGMLLGRPGQKGLISSKWISASVGGNSPGANLFASLAGALMYFATLTEVPILQGLLGNGMGKGPALALLLAGPALSLPNMLVIRSIMGNLKTSVYILLVVIMATITGMIYGALA